MSVLDHHDPGASFPKEPASPGFWAGIRSKLTDLRLVYNVADLIGQGGAEFEEVIWNPPVKGKVNWISLRMAQYPDSGYSSTIDLTYDKILPDPPGGTLETSMLDGGPISLTTSTEKRRWHTTNIGKKFKADETLKIKVTVAGDLEDEDANAGKGLQIVVSIETEDMQDQRYLLQAVRPSNTSAHAADAKLQWTLITDSNDPEYRQVVATNISEMVAGTHRLANNDTQIMRVHDRYAESARSGLSPGVNRYWISEGN